MPFVRNSTGTVVRVRCSEPLAQALGMVPFLMPDGAQLERHRLVLLVTARRPFPLLAQTYLWPSEPDLANSLEP